MEQTGKLNPGAECQLHAGLTARFDISRHGLAHPFTNHSIAGVQKNDGCAEECAKAD